MSNRIIRINEWTKNIVNFVEEDLRTQLREVIKDNPGWGWNQISIQDVYAYAMNQLAPIYGEKDLPPKIKYSEGELRSAISVAMKKINENPIHRLED
ncbi:MAG: hypothetical protein KDK54_03615 [Leptospiraceae bacterium]|nr:hypothetical protein [Leptospiraceae bacterium]